MNPKQAYAGQLPTEPMVIPPNTVLLLYGPSGNVSANMIPRRGMSDWVVDFNGLGADSLVPIDGKFWGLVYATGPGTIQFVYFPRDLVPAVRFDTVKPVIISSQSRTPFLEVDQVVIGGGSGSNNDLYFVQPGTVFYLVRFYETGAKGAVLSVGNATKLNEFLLATDSGSGILLDAVSGGDPGIFAPNGIPLFPDDVLNLFVPATESATYSIEGYTEPL
jgi:hypothetical protein